MTDRVPACNSDSVLRTNRCGLHKKCIANLLFNLFDLLDSLIFGQVIELRNEVSESSIRNNELCVRKDQHLKRVQFAHGSIVEVPSWTRHASLEQQEDK